MKTTYTPMAEGFFPELARGAALFETINSENITEQDVRKSLAAEYITERDFCILLSPAAEQIGRASCRERV